MVDASGIENVEVIDINGRTMAKINHGNAIDCGNIASGFYVVNITTATGCKSIKIEL